MIRDKKIYVLQSQRLNHGDFNDHPEVLMGLPPSEKISEFWRRYDRQADTHDTKMTQDLSENLDVLLIFVSSLRLSSEVVVRRGLVELTNMERGMQAALFSAINTTFISLTMPSLSSDPLAETNALLRLLVTRADNNTLTPADLSPPFAPSSNSVIVNCLLYASLSCSLLAAMGAMMGKEWLQSFDRTGQTGPLEEQGRFRQRKFNGVQQWHLEPIIRSLPNILLLSVILFFAGVCLFLFPVNRAVAGIVIAFSGGGAFLSGAAIVAGASSPLCPYQSAASRALKRVGRLFGRLFSLLWWKGLVRGVVDFVFRRLPELVKKTLDARDRYPNIASAIVQSVHNTLLPATLSTAVIHEQAEVAQAAGWLLGTTSNHADQIAAVQFICTLDRTAYVFAFEDWETRRRLVFLTHEAFDIWYSRPTESNQGVAELFGFALCRVVLQRPGDASKREDLTTLPLFQSKSFGGTFLRAFKFASTNYMCYRFEDQEMILHIAFLLAIINRGPVIPEYQWTGLSRFFLTGNTPHLVDVLLGLWAKAFCNIKPEQGTFKRSHAFGELVDEGDNKIVLARDLSSAITCGARVLSSVQANHQLELHIMHGYTACLQRAAELLAQIPRRKLGDVIDGVMGVIFLYVDALTSSIPEESGSELVGVSIESVLALHAFVGKNPLPSGIPISRGPRTGQLRTNDLIYATVQIMSNDFESLISSTLLPRTLPQDLARVRALALARARGERVWVRRREWDLEWEWVQVRAFRLEGEKERARALVRARARAGGPAGELEVELVGKRVGELARELVGQLEQELGLVNWSERMLRMGLYRALYWALARALAEALAGVLARTLSMDDPRDRALYRAQAQEFGVVLDQAIDQAIDQALEGMREKMAKNLAKRLEVESSILKLLLWVWERTSGTQLGHPEKRKILFISSCQLWAPLEARVDFTINGIEWGLDGERLTFDDGNRYKLLTSDDLNRIVEFAEDIQKDWEKSKFIARNADVGINRLYVHFKRRVDWNYDLYDFREQRTSCSRSTVLENSLI